MKPSADDSLFEAALRSPTATAALMRHILSAPLVEMLAWETLARVPELATDPEVAGHSALLFSVEANDVTRPGRVYLLVERRGELDRHVA